MVGLLSFFACCLLQNAILLIISCISYKDNVVGPKAIIDGSVVSLFRRFKIQLIDPESVTYANSITLPMKNGLNVQLTH